MQNIKKVSDHTGNALQIGSITVSYPELDMITDRETAKFYGGLDDETLDVFEDEQPGVVDYASLLDWLLEQADL